MPQFQRYLGIDYSGASTPEAALPGLRVYEAVGNAPARERLPVGAGRYWSRRGLAAFLEQYLRAEIPSVVGMDHAFSFPRRYFVEQGLTGDWAEFLQDFHRVWPSDLPGVRVETLRRGAAGQLRGGNARWRRHCELRARAKSVFHFDVPGSVAKSTHAGLPWLAQLRMALGATVHWWPFDGWTPPPATHVVAECYPSLWSGRYSREGRSPDQQDAYAVAESLRLLDQQGELADYFHPVLSPEEARDAPFEGWILGVR